MNDTRTPTEALTDCGVSIWLDDLSRDRIRSGALQRLIAERNVVGITTNPTIFATAMRSGNAYRSELQRLAGSNSSAADAIFELTTSDVRDACDVFRPVFDATDHVDGRVSIEVSPGVAHDTAETVAEALALAKAVDRPNAFIKIPATGAGLGAITECIAQGISINVTLIFSLDRYREVIDAYFDGLALALAAGRDLAAVHSVASFFVSRVDVEIDRRLDGVGTERAKPPTITDRFRGTLSRAPMRRLARIWTTSPTSASPMTTRWSGSNPKGSRSSPRRGVNCSRC